MAPKITNATSLKYTTPHSSISLRFGNCSTTFFNQTFNFRIHVFAKSSVYLCIIYWSTHFTYWKTDIRSVFRTFASYIEALTSLTAKLISGMFSDDAQFSCPFNYLNCRASSVIRAFFDAQVLLISASLRPLIYFLKEYRFSFALYAVLYI